MEVVGMGEELQQVLTKHNNLSTKEYCTMIVTGQVVSCWPFTLKAWVHSQARYAVDAVSLRQFFLQVLWFSHVSITPPMLCTYILSSVPVTALLNKIFK
jgi:uncharacterized membrane protein (DUF106 family)